MFFHLANTLVDFNLILRINILSQISSDKANVKWNTTITCKEMTTSKHIVKHNIADPKCYSSIINYNNFVSIMSYRRSINSHKIMVQVATIQTTLS